MTREQSRAHVIQRLTEVLDAATNGQIESVAIAFETVDGRAGSTFQIGTERIAGVLFRAVLHVAIRCFGPEVVNAPPDIMAALSTDRDRDRRGRMN